MNTNTNNQTKQEQETVRGETVKVVEKSSTWCKVIGGLTVTAAIGAGAYYAYKKFFKNEGGETNGKTESALCALQSENA